LIIDAAMAQSVVVADRGHAYFFTREAAAGGK
jgi:hypothetical protein